MLSRITKTGAAALLAAATVVSGCGEDSQAGDTVKPGTENPDTPKPPSDDDDTDKDASDPPDDDDDEPPLNSPDDDDDDPIDPPPPVKTFKPLRIGLLPDTQAGGDNVALYPMKAVLSKFEELDVDIVIPVGDLTDYGSTAEFVGWTDTAREFREKGMEFLPLMGNHEDSYSYTVEWIDFMQEFIPEDAYHLSGAEYLDYYVVRENVLIILLRYYHLPVAFPWIKKVVEENRDHVDHIVIASHDGLIGAKYGETREMIVEGVEGDDSLFDQWDEIRAFFSKHDVLWVQGHEHMYQRSVVRGPIGHDLSSWTSADGPYRMPMYTQLVAGNASYKGYEFRYGERELVQNVIQQKMNTLSNGSPAFDANATILLFDNQRVDMQAYFTEHTIKANAEGAKELENPDWKLFDKFSRSTKRCERVVFPNSIPASTRPVMQFDPGYWTNECVAGDGSVARLIDGVNNTFNRVESTTRTLSWTPGFSRAQSQNELMRLAYQFLFQYHEPWTPNLNGRNRIVPNPDDQYEVIVPETTIDLKEHLTLSWLAKTDLTLSDILIVSGTQNHTGIFSSAYGAQKDIEVDPGLAGSQPDGSAKQPVMLPPTATKKWDISDAVADAYTLEFSVPSSVSASGSVLARRSQDGWQPLASDACVVRAAYASEMLTTPPSRSPECASEPLVGFDESNTRWWTVLQEDVEVALVQK